MNIRELDEESRRTGVWPPRRIVLRVEREGEAAESPGDGQSAPVKLAEVDPATRRPAAAPPKPRPAPAPLPAPSLSPSVTPSRRAGLPGSRGVTPAPAVSAEDAAFEKWLAEPLANTDSGPEYQAPPASLPDNLRVRAERRHRRVSRKARTQLFGASAATTLAVGGCAAALSLFGLSQTETVGGSLGVPSIGLFGTPPEPQGSSEPADAATQGSAAKQPDGQPETRQASPRRTPAAAPSGRAADARSTTSRSPRSRTSAPSASPPPTQRANDRPAEPQRRSANPPPAPPPPPPAPVNTPRPSSQPKPSSGSQSPPVVWDAPSQPTRSAPAPTAPSRPAPSAPSRPAPSGPPTTSSPAP